MSIDWAPLKDGLRRLAREFKTGKSVERVAALSGSHRELCEAADDLYAAIRDEAQINVDHGNGTGAIIKRQNQTIKEYLASLDRLADRITAVEGDRQDAYDATPSIDWYSRGDRRMRSHKFNPNHDPETGRFTSGDGGSTGGSPRRADGSPRNMTADRGPYVSPPLPVTASDIRRFNRQWDIDLNNASKEEIEQALRRAADSDMGATDGGIAAILDIADHFGVRDPWDGQAKSVPGAHQVYR